MTCIYIIYFCNYLLSYLCFAATAIMTLMNSDSGSSTQEPKPLPQREILEKTKEVCDVLQLEFIFAKACQSLDLVVTEAIHNFIEKNILMEVQVI